MHPHIANVLVADDSLLDIELVRELLARAKINFTWHTARDGEEVLVFLENALTHNTSLMPDLLVLDVNLPKREGLDVLQFVKENPRLKHLPVIMLTGSDLVKDVMRAKTLGAAGYVVKPLNPVRFKEVISTIPTLKFESVNDALILCRTEPSEKR